MVEWLTDPAKREARIAELARLRDEVGQGGASRHAAEYILKTLLQRPDPVPRPHFLPSEACSGQRLELANQLVSEGGNGSGGGR